MPTRYRPSVSLEEVDPDSVILRVNATPLRAEDGSQLAEEVLLGLRDGDARERDGDGDLGEREADGAFRAG